MSHAHFFRIKVNCWLDLFSFSLIRAKIPYQNVNMNYTSYCPTPTSKYTHPRQESDFNRDLITGCSRFLSYFCRVSRRNQMACFDHITYFLEQSDIGLCKSVPPPPPHGGHNKYLNPTALPPNTLPRNACITSECLFCHWRSLCIWGVCEHWTLMFCWNIYNVYIFLFFEWCMRDLTHGLLT